MSEMVDMEKLAAVWRKMQDRRDNLRHEYEAADEAVKAQQEVVSTALLSAMNGLKADRLQTKAGTIERGEDYKVSAADWQAVYRFIADGNEFGMLHKRLSSGFVKEYAKQHKGEYPPGVNVFREFTVNVKKPAVKELPR